MAAFVDYYELLQLHPKADVQTINRVYRMLAARYHPDNPTTADPEKFLLLRQAVETLTDPDLRAAYDSLYRSYQAKSEPTYHSEEFEIGSPEAEAGRRLGVLTLLYNRRRLQPDNPWISMLELEQKLGTTRESLEFTIWYLRGKACLQRGDGGDLSITPDGVDYLEANMPKNGLMRLLKPGRVPHDANADDSGLGSTRTN